MSEDARARVRKEYAKKQRQTAKVNKACKERQPADKDESPTFNYGQLIVNDTIKMDLFKEIVKEFRMPQKEKIKPSLAMRN
jgi:hypothetical protein